MAPTTSLRWVKKVAKLPKSARTPISIVVLGSWEGAPNATKRRNKHKLDVKNHQNDPCDRSGGSSHHLFLCLQFFQSIGNSACHICLRRLPRHAQCILDRFCLRAAM